MSKIDSKLDTLKGLLDPLLSGASPQKKKYANELFLDIITDLNKSEINAFNLKMKLDGFTNKDEYNSAYEKALDVLILMGAGDIPFDMLSKKNMRWLCEHNDNQNRPFTFKELYQVERMLRMFEGIEDRMPESSEELKNYFKD